MAGCGAVGKTRGPGSRLPSLAGRATCDAAAMRRESELPETRERRCPACQSDAIASVGHVVAEDGWIKVEHRCEACGIRFRFVRKPIG